METTLKLIDNIAENLRNGDWTAAADDIGLVDRPKGLLLRIMENLKFDEDEYYPISEEAERWLKANADLLFGEYACGNI